MTKKNAPQQRKPKGRSAGITEQHHKFVREYLICLNATQAAINAGYTARSAHAQGYRLLKKAEIQRLISEAQQRTADRLELSRDDVIRQYQRIGFSDPRKLFNRDGTIKSITELDDDTAAAVQGYEIEYRQLDGPDAPPVPVLKIKWADRRAALDSIMKAQGWNAAEKFEHGGKNGGPIETVTRIVKVPIKQQAEVSTRPLNQPDGE